MGTEKNAEQRSIDEKKRLERERWEREMRERERRELDEEWEAERSRAGAWERAKAAILAGTAVIECSWGSYGPDLWINLLPHEVVVDPHNGVLLHRIRSDMEGEPLWEETMPPSMWKKPLWEKAMPLSEREIERLRTLCASIVLPKRKCKPRGVASGCDGGFENWRVCAGDETLCSLCGFDTLRLPYGSAKWGAEEAAERNAFAPLFEMLREFQEKAEKCKPAEGELEKIAEKRMERFNAARKRKERKRAGD